MKNNAFIIFLTSMLFFKESISTKNFSEPDYVTVVPVYIDYVLKKRPCQMAVNEAILARYFLALKAPALRSSLHEANAYFALGESFADGHTLPEFYDTTRSVLKVALEQSRDNSDVELDKESYANLLEQTYYEFPSVSQQALDRIQNRITLFGESLTLLTSL